MFQGCIRPLIRLGHPLLREKARKVEIHEIPSFPIQQLIADLTLTMRTFQGVGLAAPQIAESLQIAVVEFSKENSRYPNLGTQPLTVFINPVVTILDFQERSQWEGCLSIPGIRGFVHRPRKVQIDYVDENGREQQLLAEDFLATVLQHELDHLEGLLFVDRVRDTKMLAFTEEYQQFWMKAV